MAAVATANKRNSPFIPPEFIKTGGASSPVAGRRPHGNPRGVNQIGSIGCSRLQVCRRTGGEERTPRVAGPAHRELHSAARADALCKTPAPRRKQKLPRLRGLGSENRVCPAFVPFDPEASCKECLVAASVSIMPPKAHLLVSQSQSYLQFFHDKTRFRVYSSTVAHEKERGRG